MIPIEHLLVGIAVFLVASIAASKLSMQSGVPALLLFLALGMLAGSDGPGGIYFDYPWLAQAVGVIALVFILFSGGLDTRWREIRPVLWQGIALSTVGVLINALAVGWFTTTLLGFSWAEGVLLGAIISSTDAAAVFSVLRGKNVGLRGRLKPLLELESGSNDPMAVFLTIGMTNLLIHPEASALDLVPLFALQMGIGAALGYLMGRGMLLIINRLRLEYDGLYPVLMIALVLLSYGATASLGGNGFLAVYLAGLVMGRNDFIHKRSLLHFHDGLAWLMQIVMFLTLGLQVYPSRLPEVAGTGLLVALFLILGARPLSVFIALALARLSLRDKAFISWVGLRGAAPIILATFPLLGGVPQADIIFNLVFFIVLASVLVQGTLIAPVARWLKVYAPAAAPSPSPLLAVMQNGAISNDLEEITIARDSDAVSRQVLDLHLPEGALIVLICRDDELIVPSGGTIIRAGDRVLLLATDEVRGEVYRLLHGPTDSTG